MCVSTQLHLTAFIAGHPLNCPLISYRTAVTVASSEIQAASLHRSRPRWTHAYATPFLPFYPLLAYTYFIKYDDWLKSEEWTFLACTTLGLTHALTFLATRWSTGARALLTTSSVRTFLRLLLHTISDTRC